MMAYPILFECQACHGFGYVSDIAYVPEDKMAWTDDPAAQTCRSCDGHGIVWAEPEQTTDDSAVTHVTPAGGNVFSDLGFSKEEATKLKKEASKSSKPSKPSKSSE